MLPFSLMADSISDAPAACGEQKRRKKEQMSFMNIASSIFIRRINLQTGSIESSITIALPARQTYIILSKG